MLVWRWETQEVAIVRVGFMLFGQITSEWKERNLPRLTRDWISLVREGQL